MAKVLLEQLVNSYYVKYDRMSKIIAEAFKGSSAESINIYIDMYSMIKSIYGNDYEMRDYSILSSCIINMCSHYREFFWRRCQVTTNFYIVYSRNCPYINNQWYKDYNIRNQKKFNSDQVKTDMIDHNVRLLELLCPYLPDIYFIKSDDFETGVIIYDLILRNEKQYSHKVPHMIITKDIYNYQLAAVNDNIMILRPKKTENGDESYYINRFNLINTYLRDRDTKIHNDTLMPSTLTLIMTLSSVKERSIKLMCNVSTALKSIQNAIDNLKILNGYNSDINLVWNGLDTSKFKLDEISFCNRFKAIDIPYQHKVYYNTPECKKISESLINLDDPITMKAINNQYFEKCPLAFDKL